MPPLPVSQRGYPHPELLAETDWLAARLSDPTIRVVDARTDEDYTADHIPGARFLHQVSGDRHEWSPFWRRS